VTHADGNKILRSPTKYSYTVAYLKKLTSHFLATGYLRPT